MKRALDAWDSYNTWVYGSDGFLHGLAILASVSIGFAVLFGLLALMLGRFN